VLAATALIEAAGDPAVPRSLILAGGPIDTRVNPTAINAFAQGKGTAWFERNVITRVPWPLEGCGRAVYPGFLQLSGFMSMNLHRHVQAYWDMILHLVRGDGDSAAKHRKFYGEYLAVMDLTAEFYLQTIDSVFVRHLLPRGLLTWRGRAVDVTAIRRPALMTVEGGKDDITGTGQCRAALELCTGVPAARKSHFECPTVGHYGIFTGARFRQEIAPRVSAFLRYHGSRTRPRAGVTISAVTTRRARGKWAANTGSSLKTNTLENAA
jgi:poly(3-hydroxybutyrate) depolymerase